MCEAFHNWFYLDVFLFIDLFFDFLLPEVLMKNFLHEYLLYHLIKQVGVIL